MRIRIHSPVWTELDWTGLDWIGLDWTKCIEQDWTEVTGLGIWTVGPDCI